MDITFYALDFIYLNNKVRARIDAMEPKTQWSGNLRIEVIIDYGDSVDAMKEAAITAAKDFLTRVASTMDDPANVHTGPLPIS